MNTDDDIQALLHQKLYGDSKLYFGEDIICGDNNKQESCDDSYGDNKGSGYDDNRYNGDNRCGGDKRYYRDNKPTYQNTAVVLNTKVMRKPSTSRESPQRREAPQRR